MRFPSQAGGVSDRVLAAQLEHRGLKGFDRAGVDGAGANPTEELGSLPRPEVVDFKSFRLWRGNESGQVSVRLERLVQSTGQIGIGWALPTGNAGKMTSVNSS
ncbi:hypothetical protein [Winogradskya humida]|uniref:hypothetical protein n=1 Tax=Winogradskya humida TaxID=113566 RepID=UPI001EF372C8|nr:hypothetical protein [Actinoplanes humidus]